MHKIKHYLPLISILVIGTVLRFYHNTDISLWHDEAFSALLIKYSWGEMFYRIGLDVHPPAYYILLRLWHYIFSDSLLSLRSFSIFFGVGTIFAGYAFVKTAFKNERTALIAAMLLAINPFQLHYVTEARMYTMGACFALLAAFALTKALHAQKDYFQSLANNIPHSPESATHKKTAVLYYILFTLLCSLIMYTHYYLFFTVAALCLYGLAYHLYHYKDNIKRYALLVSCYVLLAALFLPWLKTFLFQFKQVSGNYWIPPMDRWSIPSAIWEMFLGIGIDISKTSTQALILTATAFTLFFLYRFIKKSTSWEKWLVLLNVLAPFAGALLFLVLAKLRGQDSSVFLVRYFLFASSFYTIALAIWLTTIKNIKVQTILISILIFANLGAFFHYWNELDIKTKPGMAAASQFLQANVEASHKIYIGSSFEFFNFKYYNQTPVKPLLYSGGNREVKNLPHYAGTAILTNEDLLPNFAESVKSGDTVWLLWTNGFGGSKPDVPLNWKQIDEKGYAEVRPYVGTWVIVTEYKVN